MQKITNETEKCYKCEHEITNSNGLIWVCNNITRHFKKIYFCTFCMTDQEIPRNEVSCFLENYWRTTRKGNEHEDTLFAKFCETNQSLSKQQFSGVMQSLHELNEVFYFANIVHQL